MNCLLVNEWIWFELVEDDNLMTTNVYNDCTIAATTLSLRLLSLDWIGCSSKINKISKNTSAKWKYWTKNRVWPKTLHLKDVPPQIEQAKRIYLKLSKSSRRTSSGAEWIPRKNRFHYLEEHHINLFLLEIVFAEEK